MNMTYWELGVPRVDPCFEPNYNLSLIICWAAFMDCYDRSIACEMSMHGHFFSESFQGEGLEFAVKALANMFLTRPITPIYF